MKRFNSAETSVIRHHYEKKLLELEQEKKILQVIAVLCSQFSLSTVYSNNSNSNTIGREKLRISGVTFQRFHPPLMMVLES